MKWMRHMTATWNDERIAKLVDNGGMEGLAMYGLYWRIQEIIGSQMEGGTPSCSVRYTVTRWSLLLSLRGSLVFSTLSRLGVTGLVTVTREGSDIIVTNRNLLKYRDEYSRKSGQKTDSVPSIIEENIIEKIEEVQTPKTPHSKNAELELPEWLSGDVMHSFLEHRKKLKKPMTDYAQKIFVSQAEKLYEQGFDVLSLIDEAILGGWQKLYPKPESPKRKPVYREVTGEQYWEDVPSVMKFFDKEIAQ